MSDRDFLMRTQHYNATAEAVSNEDLLRKWAAGAENISADESQSQARHTSPTAEATNSAVMRDANLWTQITVDQVAEMLCRRLCDAADNM